ALAGGEVFRRAFARLLALLGLALLWALAFGVCLLFGALFVWAISGGSFIMQPGLSFVLFLVFMVPATILFVIWMVAVPACVVEGTGPVASIVRSSGLTSGFRLQIFGSVLQLILLFLVVP